MVLNEEDKATNKQEQEVQEGQEQDEEDNEEPQEDVKLEDMPAEPFKKRKLFAAVCPPFCSNSLTSGEPSGNTSLSREKPNGIRAIPE
ncbi:hypothetical protein AC249_AIPGENE6863 [Exaiptasia diaphana]|nr:hypothetical protein AC249_AIPGENE6863 [Exaiptasia diaphana]